MDVKGRGRVVRLEGDPFLQVCFMFDHFYDAKLGKFGVKLVKHDLNISPWHCWQKGGKRSRWRWSETSGKGLSLLAK